MQPRRCRGRPPFDPRLPDALRHARRLAARCPQPTAACTEAPAFTPSSVTPSSRPLEGNASSLPPPYNRGMAPSTPLVQASPRPSIDPIFRPRSVALIGASRERHSIGWDILDNLLRYEFQGQVFPVNPRADGRAQHEVLPLDRGDSRTPWTWRSSRSQGSGGRAGRGVRPQGREGARRHHGGFKEVGEAGAAMEQQVVEVVAPLRHADGRAQLHGRHQHRPRRAAAGLVLGHHRADRRQHRLLLAVGRARRGHSRADVAARPRPLDVRRRSATRPTCPGTTCSSCGKHDPRTRVILMYLESFGNPQRFVRDLPGGSRTGSRSSR